LRASAVLVVGIEVAFDQSLAYTIKARDKVFRRSRGLVGGSFQLTGQTLLSCEQAEGPGLQQGIPRAWGLVHLVSAGDEGLVEPSQGGLDAVPITPTTHGCREGISR
jgi:hypothetical protein